MFNKVQIFNEEKGKRSHNGLTRVALAIAPLLLCAACANHSVTPMYTASIVVSNQAINSVDSRLFGHLLEKSSEEEGPELVASTKTGKLPESIVSTIRDMKVPIVRFSGGADVESTDWTDLISNAPGGPRFRPLYKKRDDGSKLGLRFGIDEFGRLKREVGFEAILVVNLLDALARKRPVREAAEVAAGLVAYCNTPEGAKLRKSLRHWPSIRSRNGSPITFGVEYVQLGSGMNDAAFKKQVRAAVPHLGEPELVQWYIDCIGVYIQLIKHVDPNIKIILDGSMSDDISRGVLSNASIHKQIDFLSLYRYGPESSPDYVEAQTDDELWIEWVCALGDYDSIGNNIAIRSPSPSLGKKPIVCAEWSWDPARLLPTGTPRTLDWQMPSALSCASWLNGLIRSGDAIKIATMANLLGDNIGVSSILVSSNKQSKATLGPQGRVTSLYSRHHGSTRIALEATGIPMLTPSVPVQSDARVARVLDVAATASPSTVFLHAVNKSRDKQAQVKVSFAGLSIAETYTMHIIADTKPSPADDAPQQSSVKEQSRQMTTRSKRLIKVTIPSASVVIIEIPLLKR